MNKIGKTYFILLPLVDHIKVNATMNNLKTPGKNLKNTRTNNAATSSGNRQYPKRQIHCIKDIFPPSNFVFNVIIIEPIHMIIKTVVKTIPDSFFDVIDKILKIKINNKILAYNPKVRHITNGPQRSQYFNSLTFSSLTYGTITTLNFNTILLKSLSCKKLNQIYLFFITRLAQTDSFKVLYVSFAFAESA